MDSRWSACGPWCDHYQRGRLASWCVDRDEWDTLAAARVSLGQPCGYKQEIVQLSLELREAGAL